MTEPASAATALALVQGLAAAGLRHVCIAPGSRSGPLALAACRHPALTTTVHLDERGACFFALGHAKATGVPAAVICTSGTAVANLLPAAIEARYSATPLVLVTADRPPSMRDTGAWQTIDQVGIFGRHVRWSAEVPLSGDGEAARVARNLGSRAVATALAAAGPVHLNVPLAEPLTGPQVDDFALEEEAGAVRSWPGARTVPEEAIQEIARLVRAEPRGLIVAGTMAPSRRVREAIRALAAASGYPVLADAASNVRFPLEDPAGATGMGGNDAATRGGEAATGAPADLADRTSAAAPVVVAGAEAILRNPWAERNAPGLVIRFGASPVWRPVAEYVSGAPNVMVDPHGLWDDPARVATERLVGDPADVANRVAAAIANLAEAERIAWRELWLVAEQQAAAAHRASLSDTRPADLESSVVGLESGVAGLESGVAGPGSGVAGLDRTSAGHESGGHTLWVVPALLGALPDGAQVWVANSMAVREMDSFGRSERDLSVLVNRGAAGIDGTISSALGAALGARAPTVLLTGDLAFLHDANGLLAADQVPYPVVVVVLNDHGGGIFAYLPGASEPEFERVFRTPQSADLAAVGRGFRAAHAVVRSAEELARAVAGGLSAATGVTVVEVPVDPAANTAAHGAYWADVARRLDQPGDRAAAEVGTTVDRRVPADRDQAPLAPA